MSGHEARINDALKQLGEEFRLGMVAVDEYRSRRRMLLDSWGEKDTTTSPGAMKLPPAVTPAAAVRPPAPAPAKAKPKGKGPLVAGIIACVVVVAVGSYMVLVPKRTPIEAKPGTPAVAPANPQVQAIKKAADDFLARNAWEAEPINAFIAQWRQLSAADRARALEEPSLKTLRYELAQNIQAESQLVPADAPPEQRQRLELLTQFARELDGSTS
jgi:hypothetical protein